MVNGYDTYFNHFFLTTVCSTTRQGRSPPGHAPWPVPWPKRCRASAPAACPTWGWRRGGDGDGGIGSTRLWRRFSWEKSGNIWKNRWARDGNHDALMRDFMGNSSRNGYVLWFLWGTMRRPCRLVGDSPCLWSLPNWDALWTEYTIWVSLDSLDKTCMGYRCQNPYEPMVPW